MHKSLARRTAIVLVLSIFLLSTLTLGVPDSQAGEEFPEPLQGSCNGSGEPPGSGNWTITESTYCHNITLTLYGNITVYGESPTETVFVLDNVTLNVDTTWNMTWYVGNNTPATERYATWHINNTEIHHVDPDLFGTNTYYYSLQANGGIRIIHSNISHIGLWTFFGTSAEDRWKYVFNSTIQSTMNTAPQWQMCVPAYGISSKSRFDNNTIWDNHTSGVSYWLRHGYGWDIDFHFGNNTMHCRVSESFCPFGNRVTGWLTHYHSWANRLHWAVPDWTTTGVWNGFPNQGYDHYYERANVVVFDISGNEITESITVTNGWGETTYSGDSGNEFWVEAYNISDGGYVKNYTMNPYSVSLDNYDYVKAIKFNGTQITRAIAPLNYEAYPDHYNQINITASRFWRMDARKVMYRWDDLGYCISHGGGLYPNATMQEHIGWVETVHDNFTGAEVMTHAIIPAHYICPNSPVELSEDSTWMIFINGLKGGFTDHSYTHANPSIQSDYLQGQCINASYNWSVAYLPERFYTWSAPSSNWNNYTEQHIGNEFSYSKDYINLAGTEIGDHLTTNPQEWNGKGLAGINYTFHSVGFTSWVPGDNYETWQWAYLGDFASYPIYLNFWTSMNHWWQMDNYADGSYNWTKWDEWNQSMLWIDNMNVDYYTMNAYARWSKNIEDVEFDYNAGQDRYYVDCLTCDYKWDVKFTYPTTWSNPRVWDITDINNAQEISWSSNYTELVFEQQLETEYVICDGCELGDYHEPNNPITIYGIDADFTYFGHANVLTFKSKIQPQRDFTTTWYYGDGTTSSKDEEHLYEDSLLPKRYDVRLQVCDRHSCVNETKMISVIGWSGILLWSSVVFISMFLIITFAIRNHKKKPKYEHWWYGK